MTARPRFNPPAVHMTYEDRRSTQEDGPFPYLISPELAQRFLCECNVQNRTISPTRPKRYLSVMERDKWSRSRVHTLAFDSEGILINGQNRLGAIAEGKMPVLVWVVVGVHPNERSTIDTGIRRTATAIAEICGHPLIKPNSPFGRLGVKIMSNLSRKQENWCTGEPLVEQVLDAAEPYLVEIHKVIEVLDQRALVCKEQKVPMNKAISRVGFLVAGVEMLKADSVRGEAFLRSVIEEHPLPEGHAARTLVGYLIKRSNGGGSKPYMDYNGAWRAWEAYIGGEELFRIREAA